MAYHGVLIPRAIASTNVDAWNRSVVSASDLDNGYVVKLTGRSTSAGYEEVFTAVVPSSSNGLANLWMIYSGDGTVITNSLYRGIDPDIRNFYTAAGKVVRAFKPKVGDIVRLSAEALAGTYSASTSKFVNATDSTGGFKLVWGTSQTASVTSFAFLGEAYLSITDGTLGSTQRMTMYDFECVAE